MKALEMMMFMRKRFSQMIKRLRIKTMISRRKMLHTKLFVILVKKMLKHFLTMILKTVQKVYSAVILTLILKILTLLLIQILKSRKMYVNQNQIIMC